MKKILFSLLSVAFLISCSSGKKVEVLVSNQMDLDRTDEIVELSRDSVVEKLGLAAGETFIVTDAASKQVPYQVATNPSSETDSLLIFPATVKAGSTSTYVIKKGTPENFEPKVYGRLVPERKDDFTWENDKMAFRVYGPALQATGEISSGIDVWAKRTDKLIIDKWYADDLSGKQSYHSDNGDGLDYYKVGPTLGAGASAPFINDSLWYSKNFTNYTVLDNGPLRITVRYNFEPYQADKIEVTPTRVISLEAGSFFNKVVYSYEFMAEELPVATGVVIRQMPDEITVTDVNKYFATYKEPVDSLNGTLYTGFIGAKPFNSIEVKKRHILGFQTVKPVESYVYYTGAGWSKGSFLTYEDWNNYVSDFSAKVKNPLIVKIQ